MNSAAELNLQSLCLPTLYEVLRQTFIISDDRMSRVASLNMSDVQIENFAMDVLSELEYDIRNLADNDPAAQNTNIRERYVWESYKGLKAIMYYRIANHLLDFEHNCLMPQQSGYFADETDDDILKDYMRMQARKLSERAARETTIEINPSAQIGRGFVIDHGIGTKVAPGDVKFSTVVGETCVIGDDCTLLNSVLLGASVINEASTGTDGVATGKRHPTLGNNVTVCAGVRILGNIRIGNRVTIGPCCVITTDIPDDYEVTIVNQLQYTRPSKGNGSITANRKPMIHGLTGVDTLTLYGENLDSCNLSIVTFQYEKEQVIKSLSVEIIDRTKNHIAFKLKSGDVKTLIGITQFSLKIESPGYELILSNPPSLNNYIRIIMKGVKTI